MSVLDRKLLRDLIRLWAQALAVALVMACGVTTIVVAVGAYRSLVETRDTFYDRYRFASVFATATRAPLHLRERLATIAGVSGVELRIVRPVLLDIIGMAEPATGIAVSIPDRGEPSVNRLYLRTGRLPEPGRAGDEVAVTEPFALAHGMGPGNRFDAILNGQKRTLTITGIVLSPEYIYAVGPGDFVPDQRRFGVFFMAYSAMAGLFDMEGAFNDVVLTTRRGVSTAPVIDAVDRLLAPYGGTGAYGRGDQMSNAFLDAELTQLRGMAMVTPPVFLFIAAFLVNMILSRLIALEREQIGLLKAVGYGRLAIAWHYAKLTLIIASVGILIGAGAGRWLGRAMTRLYAEYYTFPFLIFRESLDLYAAAAAVTVIAALAGSARAIAGVVSLQPAVAMQPPAPTLYSSVLSDAGRHIGLFSQLTVMALRHLLRWPVRTLMTMLGTALSVALLITAMFTFDSIDYLIDAIFFRAERQDATLTFRQELSPRALLSVAGMPGVMRAEPFRSTPVILRNGLHQRRLAITGVPYGADLSRVLDQELEPVESPPAGLLVSDYVAKLLQLRIGDMTEVELLTNNRRIAAVPVTDIVNSYIGMAVYMRSDALDRLLGDGPRISGVWISVDPASLLPLYETVKNTPAVASIALQGISRERFRETVAENIMTMTVIYVVLAFIITFGVIYNSARIQLSERARELASLRVFGFTRAEVSGVLLLELAVIVVLAQPLGWALGYGLARIMVQGMASDLFRIPFIIESSTFALASLVVLGTALVSMLIVRRRVDRLDLISVLKTRE